MLLHAAILTVAALGFLAVITLAARSRENRQRQQESEREREPDDAVPLAA